MDEKPLRIRNVEIMMYGNFFIIIISIDIDGKHTSSLKQQIKQNYLDHMQSPGMSWALYVDGIII